MTRRWRPPPYWPPPPDPDWTPPAGWQPDPSWPPPPPGWQFWEDDRPSRAPYWVGLAVLTVVGLAVAGSLSDDGTTVADGAPAGAVETASTTEPAPPPPTPEESVAAVATSGDEEAAETSAPAEPKHTTKPKPKRTNAPTATKPKPKKTKKPAAKKCDPNYAGGCVPIASDVDGAPGRRSAASVGLIAPFGS